MRGFIDKFLLFSFVVKLSINVFKKNSISVSLIIFTFLEKTFEEKNIKNTKLKENFIKLDLIIPPSSFFCFNFIFFRV